MADVDVAVQEFSSMDEFSKPSPDILRKILLSQDVKLSLQLRALYFCRDLDISECTAILTNALKVHYDTFLRHEIAYVMGQSGCLKACKILVRLLEDENEDPMVRHEAAEAIAALGGKEYIDVISRYTKDESQVVRDTCMLALHSLMYGSPDDDGEPIPVCSCVSAPISTSAYRAVDPVPCGASDVKEQSTSDLGLMLKAKSNPLYTRYEALFKLRNTGGDEAATIIGEALVGDDVSEVFRHECAFVLGQMQSMAAVDSLTVSLSNKWEQPIVRHEAALALGSCGSVCTDQKTRDAIVKVLYENTKGVVKVVSDSCVVALDNIMEVIPIKKRDHMND